MSRLTAMSPRRLATAGCAAAGLLFLACACSGAPSPSGDPDPGHQSLTALEQVLSVIPAGAQVSYKNQDEPRWTSCDGRQSTYGWGPAVVDAQFSVGAASPQQVVARARATMARLAWTYDPGTSSNGQWSWFRQVGGRTAVATLQHGPPGAPRSWSLYAGAPPAVHPVTGC
ncbi:MAG TPA: hypothetical protein VFO01_05035 [Trebonia sp.]|nr:hypothetical protein [Trebonia sp.]